MVNRRVTHRGRLVPICRLVGGDLLLLSLRANRNSFRVRSRILGSYNDQGIWSVGAGFPNRRRAEQLLPIQSEGDRPAYSE